MCNTGFSLGFCCQVLWHENFYPLKIKCHPAVGKYNTEKNGVKKKCIAIMVNENVAFYCKYMHFRRKLSACVTC